jgi:hypothetical protein
VETWKENVSQKPVQRVKPTSDTMIEKYVIRQQQHNREQFSLGRPKRERVWSNNQRPE